MLDYPPSTLDHADELEPLRRFAGCHREAFCDAAGLLGGTCGVRTAMSVLSGLAAGGVPPRSLRHDIDRLRALLHLEGVHDLGRLEAACFASIDPFDPVVQEICLLADGLDDAIAASSGPALSGAMAPRDAGIRLGGATATVSRGGATLHPGKSFAVDARRRRRPAVRGAVARDTASIRADAR